MKKAVIKKRNKKAKLFKNKENLIEIHYKKLFLNNKKKKMQLLLILKYNLNLIFLFIKIFINYFFIYFNFI